MKLSIKLEVMTYLTSKGYQENIDVDGSVC